MNKLKQVAAVIFTLACCVAGIAGSFYVGYKLGKIDEKAKQYVRWEKTESERLKCYSDLISEGKVQSPDIYRINPSPTPTPSPTPSPTASPKPTSTPQPTPNPTQIPALSVGSSEPVRLPSLPTAPIGHITEQAINNQAPPQREKYYQIQRIEPAQPQAVNPVATDVATISYPSVTHNNQGPSPQPTNNPQGDAGLTQVTPTEADQHGQQNTPQLQVTDEQNASKNQNQETKVPDKTVDEMIEPMDPASLDQIQKEKESNAAPFKEEE